MFTKEELKEIEKIFDMQAGQVARYHADIVMAFSKLKGEAVDNLNDKLLREALNSFDMYRTISAKASKMQEQKGE